ncbi:hypothetical protein Tco_0673672 [Tanacetum coccineum]
MIGERGKVEIGEVGGQGEVKGGRVDFGVISSLLGDILEKTHEGLSQNLTLLVDEEIEEIDKINLQIVKYGVEDGYARVDILNTKRYRIEMMREVDKANSKEEIYAYLRSSYGYAWWWMEMARSLRLALVDHHRKRKVCEKGQGEVKGGGVDFGVINSLLGEILREVMGEME